jgi:hypothetical protein
MWTKNYQNKITTIGVAFKVTSTSIYYPITLFLTKDKTF